MRVLHVITDLGFGGAQAMLSRLVRSEVWSEDRQQVISLIDGGVHRPSIEETGVAVASLGMSPGRPSARALWSLRRRLSLARPDVVVSWLYHADLMTTLAALGLATRPALVWNVRASDMDMRAYSWSSALTRRACAWLSGRPAVVLVNSEAGRRAHDLAGYRPRRWIVIPNGIDVNEFRPELSLRDAMRVEVGIPLGAPVVGLLARLDPMKDHATFVAAALAFAERMPHARLLVAGTGVVATHPVFAPLAARPDVMSRVHLLGPRTDVVRLLNALDVLTLTSAYGEGFPNVVAEAMACGVPAVVTDVGDAAALVGPHGIVVRPRDPDALADAWCVLLARPPATRAELGRQARKRIAQDYSLDQVASTYRHTLAQLLPAVAGQTRG